MKKAAVCGIIVEDEILLLKRLPKKDLTGWCLPGGKVDEDEEPLDGAKRETLEETAIRLRGKLHYVSRQRAASGNYDVYIYYIVLKEKPGVIVNIMEHNEHAWVDMGEKLDDYQLAGNTMDFIRLILTHSLINEISTS